MEVVEKRGRGRPRKLMSIADANESALTPIEPKKKSATIIYRRQDDSDPRETTMMGIKFKADEPVEVPYSKTVLQTIVEKRETKDGDIRTVGVEKHVPVPLALKGNAWFEIDGVKTERVKPHARMPEDADAYRGYAINWISVSMSADSMDKRWVGEEGLRQRCGCSQTDINYLRPFFEARRMECAELDKQRVA